MICYTTFITRTKALLMLAVFLLVGNSLWAQTLGETALAKIDTLEGLMNEARIMGINVDKEELAVRTAEVFLFYADWDEQNVAYNTELFKLVSRYKDNAAQMAQQLPDFQRDDVVKLLDGSMAFLKMLMNGDAERRPTPKVNWASAKLDQDQITYLGRPVFIADYTWKPDKAGTYDLTEHFGNQDGYYMDPNSLNANGTIKSWKLNELKGKGNGTLGFIFFGNKKAPDWAEEKYGPGFQMREDTYTGYDIDNPGAREMMGQLIKGTVPYMKGKKFSELGYMLCNEPHFYTTKTNGKVDWASGPVSEYTFEKFRTWLAEKHDSIQALNALWGTSYTQFEDVQVPVPMDVNMIGKPMWYDWQTFNNYRVTQWYTWEKAEIRKYDPNAKVHLKVMPNLWSSNKRGHGMDMEAITELSDIVGNDAGASHSPMWGEPYDWQKHYAFEWREMCMSFDFFKSVAPHEINYNTEAHYLSTGKSRDLYLDPAFSRASYWLATTQGLSASQTWFWPKDNNGKPREGEKGYGGSNAQQPRVTYEVHSTLMDLNSFGEEVMAMQRQKKPIRIFYSETSAMNKSKHMDDLFDLYESLVFEGIPLGFATKNILSKQDPLTWNMILVHQTPYVTDAEFDTLQSYLDNGGTLIVDNISLKKDEYGRSRSKTLQASNGTLLNSTGAASMKILALNLAEDRGLKPQVSLKETNTGGHKGCIWKVVKNDLGNNVVSIVNVGKTTANLDITLKGAQVGTAVKDLLTGQYVSNTPTLKPNGVLFVEITDDNQTPIAVFKNRVEQERFARIFPNPSKGQINISFVQQVKSVSLEVFDLLGAEMDAVQFNDVSRISHPLRDQPAGTYIVRLKADGQVQNQVFVLQ